MKPHDWVRDDEVANPSFGWKYRICRRCGGTQTSQFMYSNWRFAHARADDCDEFIVQEVLET